MTSEVSKFNIRTLKNSYDPMSFENVELNFIHVVEMSCDGI